MSNLRKIKIDHKKLRPLEPTKNPFQSLVRSVIAQQISTKAAQSIMGKFKALWKKSFPTPTDVLILSDEMFASAGISPQKRSYLRDLARAFSDGTITPKKFPQMTDEEIVEHLTSVKGIGVWTAHMFLIFALNRPNVLPVGDLAIKKGFQKAFNLRSMPDEKKMHALAKAHTGEHTALSLHLWGLLDKPKQVAKTNPKRRIAKNNAHESDFKYLLVFGYWLFSISDRKDRHS